MHLHNALSKLSGCHPLHAELPLNCAPLVYPLYVDNPDQLFHMLKLQGVPIWRFGEFLDPSVTPQTCANSQQLSKHVLQFPCHQELKQSEINWLVDRVVSGLRACAQKEAER